MRETSNLCFVTTTNCGTRYFCFYEASQLYVKCNNSSLLPVFENADSHLHPPNGYFSQNPVGAGRYDVQKWEESQHKNGHGSVFQSRTGKLNAAMEKFLKYVTLSLSSETYNQQIH